MDQILIADKFSDCVRRVLADRFLRKRCLRKNSSTTTRLLIRLATSSNSNTEKLSIFQAREEPCQVL